MEDEKESLLSKSSPYGLLSSSFHMMRTAQKTDLKYWSMFLSPVSS